MSYLFNLLLVQPLFNGLVFLYQHVTFQDLGLAIILLTVFIRFLLYPLFYKAMKNQSLMQKIQPDVSRIQKEHKADKQKQAEELMKLWKEHKVNPFSGFFLILIQLPILIALYRVFTIGFKPEAFAKLYSFVSQPENINNMFLSLIDLTVPSMIIVAIAVISQAVQSYLSLPKIKPGEAPTKGQQTSRKMMWIGPILTLIILPQFSAALGVYWFTTSLFSIGQQYLINKRMYGSNRK